METSRPTDRCEQLWTVGVISVSVAMATFNGARYIREQLDSLAAQNYLPSELVITDDCSTDETPKLIEEFAARAPFPVLLHRNETRLGYRQNFMLATRFCKSELIAFCDQDDIWYPYKIEISTEPFADPEVLMVHHDSDVFYEGILKTATLALPEPSVSMHRPLTSPPWGIARGFTQLLRRSLLQFSDLWPLSRDETGERIAHDGWFFFLASVFGSIGHIPVPLAAYRQHGGNVYGFQKENLLLQAAQSMFTNYAVRYGSYEEAAKVRASILASAKPRLEGLWQERAAAAEMQYGKLAHLLESRHALYTARNPIDRLSTFYRLVRQGGYMDHWGLGRTSLLKDLFLGIAVGPALKGWRPFPNHKGGAAS